jgi:hypothetical protein
MPGRHIYIEWGPTGDADRTREEHQLRFVTLSHWPDIESMVRFTGRDPEFLVELPREIQILELRSAHGVERISPRSLPGT